MPCESSDEVLDIKLYLRLEGLPFHGYVGASYEYRRRDAVLEEFAASERLRRLSLQVGFTL